MRFYTLVLLIQALSTTSFAAKTVTVYTYDSLASKHSFGKYFATELEKEKGIQTKLVSFSTIAEAIQQLKIEGSKTKADVLWGFDNLMLVRVEQMEVLEKLDARLLKRVPANHRFESDKAVPFDYGYLAFVYDESRTTAPKGKSFLEWTKDPLLKKKIIIQDPRTSSLGQSLLAWVGSLVYADDYLPFWTAFAANLVTVAPGWSSAYGAFLKKECDYVLSYTTSPAYHLTEEKVDKYRAVVFEEGHFKQVEGVGIVTHSKQKKLAREWVEALLSDKYQAALPTRQWMYPAVPVALPPAFEKLPKVKDLPTLNKASLNNFIPIWTSEWTKALLKP